MRTRTSQRILPMQTAGTQHFIERTYRESGQFQWVRETLINAFEAKATRVEFGVEWQAVEELGVYRRMIADNGCGMTAEQLVEFFNTFGGGGKPIGGAHENFGVGSKTSLLPWNKYGMVVISWVDGDASMIWVTQDPETEEYGLKLERCEDPSGEASLDEVYEPYNDPKHGCDWCSIKPDWIEDHGTVVVLLGNNPMANTVEGDQNHSEADIKGISSFLNRRIWEIPEDVEVYVDELRTNDRTLWPQSEKEAHGLPKKIGKDRRTNTRKILGARRYIEYSSSRFTDGEMGSQGTVELRDGTEIDWYLWTGERPKIHSYAAIGGYIGALYKDELYDITTHHSTYRSFGVSESSVRSRLWLIIRPVVDPNGRHGVYPKTDRNSLLIRGGPNAGGSIPINEWATEFADNMPDEILFALREARHGSSGGLTDDEWRDKLAEKFGSRWRIARLRARQNGCIRINATEDEVSSPIRKGKGVVSSGGVIRAARTRKGIRLSKGSGSGFADEAMEEGGLPVYRAVGAEDVGPGMLAAWQPNAPDHPEGVVLINVDHPVLKSVIEHWQSQYADHHSEEIAKDVISVYGQVAVSKVAHSEHLKGILPSQVVERDLRSEESLTMALLGLMSEDHMISTRVGGKYSKKRSVVSDKPRRAQAAVASK